MENQSLGYYLKQLEEKRPNDFLDIPHPIDLKFEFQAIALELDKQPYPPIIRTHVKGYEDTTVVGNVFASRRRIAELLGDGGESEVAKNWIRVEKNTIPPVIVENGPVQEVFETENIDLNNLPLMQYYSTDAGRYISSSIVVVKDPETGVHNLSYHRMQFKGGNKFGISMHTRQHLFYYYEKAREAGKNLEVAIIVGCHPAVSMGAVARPGLNEDEYDVSGAILGEPLRLVKGRTVDIEYPAEAEVVLEGYIPTNEHEPEGPFGEFTGFSTSRSTQNLFYCTGFAHRKNPIYETTVPGRSKDHLYLAHMVCETSALTRIQEKVPWVTDLTYPISGGDMQAYIQMKQAPAGMAKVAMTMLMGLDYTVKLAVVVDTDIDIRRDDEVMWAIATRVRYGRDTFLIPESFTISLDPVSENNTVNKFGIDATMWQEMRDEVVVCRPRPEDTEKAKKTLESIVH